MQSASAPTVAHERSPRPRLERRRLHDAQVREHERRRRVGPHLERVGELGTALHRALRAQTERDAELLGDAREVAVDLRRLGGAAGHPGDEQRRAQALAEELGRDVDLVDRELGQRVVDEVDLLEQRRLAGVLDGPLLAERPGASACDR